LWNNQNESFSAPYVFPIGDLQGFYVPKEYYHPFDYTFADMNNDGYLDVVSLQPNRSKDKTGLYVFYMGANGVTDQGFVYTWFDNSMLNQVNAKWVATWADFEGYEYQVLACREALKNGWLESPYMPHQETLDIMKVMDSLRQKWGVVYPMD
jgi:hypothetical protein